jgi:hypothetical protein
VGRESLGRVEVAAIEHEHREVVEAGDKHAGEEEVDRYGQEAQTESTREAVLFDETLGESLVSLALDWTQPAALDSLHPWSTHEVEHPVPAVSG